MRTSKLQKVFGAICIINFKELNYNEGKINFFGFASIVQHPFGSGLGSFPSLLQGYGDYFELDLASHDVLSLADHIKFYPQTYLANLVNDIGVFAFILIPILLVNNDNSNKNFSSKKGICLLLMIFFQSQITSPAFCNVSAIIYVM